MEENNTIIQLNEALGELLDAYDQLKTENQELEEKLIKVTETKSQEIEELAARNNELEKKVESLTSTTKHHSSELDTMLGRIKSTLGSSLEKKESTKETILNDEPMQISDEEEIAEEISDDSSLEKEPLKKEGSKEIDLGRMQSLLNGFNS